MLSLTLHPVFDIALICVSLTNRNLLWHLLILACVHRDGKKEKTYNTQKSKTAGP